MENSLLDDFKTHKASFKEKNIELESIKDDLVEKLWKERPSKPNAPVTFLI